MEKKEKLFSMLFEGSNMLGIVALVLMMCITIAEIFCRSILNSPIRGNIEIIVYLMVCVVAFGMGRCTLKDGHIRVDLIKVGPIVEKMNHILLLFLCLVIAWQNVMQGIKVFSMGTVSQLLGIPKFPFYIVMGFGFFMIALAIVTTEFGKIKKMRLKQSKD